MTLQSLIDENRLDDAAEVVYRALIDGFNRLAPGINLTPEILTKIYFRLLNKFAGITQKEDPKTKYELTDEIGDDVVIKQSKGLLLIEYKCSDPLVKLPHPIVEWLAVGRDYYYDTPTIKGYTADRLVVAGKMIPQNIYVTITYTKNPEGPSEVSTFGEVKILHDNCKYNEEEGCTGEYCCTIEGNKTAHTIVEFIKGKFELESKNGVSSWYPGISITCPSGSSGTCSNEQCKEDCSKCNVTLKIRDWNGSESICNFAEFAECKKETAGTGKIYMKLTPEILDAPNTSDGKILYQFEIDWNGDGFVDQIIEVYFNPKDIILQQKDEGDIVWPKQNR